MTKEGSERCSFADFEDGGKSSGAKQWWQERETDAPHRAQKGMQPCQYLDLRPVRPG